MSTPMKTSSRDVEDMIKSEQVTIVQRITRVQALQIVLVLAVIIALFSIMAPDSFLTVFNLRSIMMNTAIFAVLGVANSVKSRTSYGGTAPANVRAQAKRWLARLKRETRPLA